MPNETRYTVETKAVGEGGFGKILRGRDSILERDVAVKTFNKVWETASEPDKERFRREARTLAQMSSPNIPAIYDVISSDTEFKIIFQYIDGRNLRQIISAGTLPSTSDIRVWFDQIASALEHAHSKGIIHRDVKPENMIISADGSNCYLVDFGLALTESDKKRLTKDGYVVGTPGYMSPEQEDGKTLDPSDDIYVLGVCLYETLCGHRIAAGDYQELAGKDEAIPPMIDNLIMSCIAEKPSRLQSAKEFRTRLAAAFKFNQPLSSVLAEGQLYDVVAALREMTPKDFMQLPPGQRLVLLSRAKDVIAKTDAKLNTARAEFLINLTIIGIQIDPADYKDIIDAALKYGFEVKVDDRYIGNKAIRAALDEAAGVVGKQNHSTFAGAFMAWVKTRTLAGNEPWFYHALRSVITHLMANPVCGEDEAKKLHEILTEVNNLQRELATG